MSKGSVRRPPSGGTTEQHYRNNWEKVFGEGRIASKYCGCKDGTPMGRVFYDEKRQAYVCNVCNRRLQC